MLDLIERIAMFGSDLAGVPVGFILGVFVLSSVIIQLAQIREIDSSDIRKPVMALVVFVVSSGLVVVGFDFETTAEYVRQSIILGGVSSIFYQIFKPVLKYISQYVVKRAKRMTRVSGSSSDKNK